MGILDIFKRRKKSELDEPLPPRRVTEGELKFMKNPENIRSPRSEDVASQIELITSQMQSLRLQYEAINARLQNIERLVTEIRGFCK